MLLDKRKYFGLQVDSRDSSGRTALHYACEVGDMSVVICLLRNGAKMVSSIDGKLPYQLIVDEAESKKSVEVDEV